MTKLCPATLTQADQLALLEAIRDCPREALLVALGTGLRLAEHVGLDVGDIYLPGGQPRFRVRLRAEIAKRGRAGDVFLPEGLKPKLVRFRAWKIERRERLDPTARSSARRPAGGSPRARSRPCSANCRSRPGSIAFIRFTR